MTFPPPTGSRAIGRRRAGGSRLGAGASGGPDRAAAGFHDWVEDPHALAIEQTERYGATLHFVYQWALKGYAASGLSPNAAEAIRAEPTVAYVELDGIVCAAVEDVPCSREEAGEPPAAPAVSSAPALAAPVASQASGDAAEGKPPSNLRKRCRAKRGARLSRRRPLRRCRASSGGSRRSTGIRPAL